jgi:DNA invertase Pin-like site-specific DNA recombinase
LYARVSTDSQTTENQLLQLRAVAERHGWLVVAEYIDHGVSGAKGRHERPQFDALLNWGRAARVSTWSLLGPSTVFGRSLQDLLGFLLELQSKQVDLYFHQQALDTSTPMGKAMFQLCGVFAELERSIIQERVRAGLERARAKGITLGRPQTKPNVEAKIRELAATGMGKGRIARTLGIGTSVAQRVLAT